MPPDPLGKTEERIPVLLSAPDFSFGPAFFCRKMESSLRHKVDLGDQGQKEAEDGAKKVPHSTTSLTLIFCAHQVPPRLVVSDLDSKMFVLGICLKPPLEGL